MKRFSQVFVVALCMVACLTLGVSSPVAAFGEVCEGDANDDGTTGILDFLIVLGQFGMDCSQEPCDGDVNNDGIVDVLDFLVVIGNFGCGVTPCKSSAECDDGDDCTFDLCLGQFGCLNLPICD